jgi:hypothetical protein
LYFCHNCYLLLFFLLEGTTTWVQVLTTLNLLDIIRKCFIVSIFVIVKGKSEISTKCPYLLFCVCVHVCNPLPNADTTVGMEPPYYWNGRLDLCHSVIFHHYWHQHGHSAYHFHFQQHSVIRFLWVEGLRGAEIHQRLSAQFVGEVLPINVGGFLDISSSVTSVCPFLNMSLHLYTLCCG